jgi:hypothetical protein
MSDDFGSLQEVRPPETISIEPAWLALRPRRRRLLDDGSGRSHPQYYFRRPLRFRNQVENVCRLVRRLLPQLRRVLTNPELVAEFLFQVVHQLSAVIQNGS